jgi:hypothetical protein
MKNKNKLVIKFGVHASACSKRPRSQTFAGLGQTYFHFSARRRSNKRFASLAFATR